MPYYVLKKNCVSKIKTTAFQPGPVLPPSGDGSPFLSQPTVWQIGRLAIEQMSIFFNLVENAYFKHTKLCIINRQFILSISSYKFEL